MIFRRESTIIDYHAPFDQGLTLLLLCFQGTYYLIKIKWPGFLKLLQTGLHFFSFLRNIEEFYIYYAMTQWGKGVGTMWKSRDSQITREFSFT